MGISRKSRIVLLALVGGATLAVAFLAVQHHSRSLTVLTTILGFGTGLVCTNLWPDWPRPLRKWGLAILFLALVLDVRQSWVRRETFWAICYAAVVLLAIVLFIRKLRVQSQFQGAEEWPLTK